MSKTLAYSWVQAAWAWRHHALEATIDCWAVIDQGRIKACNAMVASLIDTGHVSIDATPHHLPSIACDAFGQQFVTGFLCGQAGMTVQALPDRDPDTLDGMLCGHHARRNILRREATDLQKPLV